MSTRIDNVTVVIPTYNRPYYLDRIITFYEKTTKNVDFIVADSSNPKTLALNMKRITSSNLKIQHITYNDEVSFYDKLLDGLKYVDTNYVVFCADDDFIIPSAVVECKEFLDENVDYSVCFGNYIRFISKGIKYKWEYWTTLYSPQSIEEDDPISRMLRHLSKYNVATFYAVHRTALLKNNIAKTVEYNEDMRFAEIFSSVLSLIQGKMKHMDILFGIRESNPNSDGATIPKFVEYIKNGSFQRRYRTFREGLLTSLEELEVDHTNVEGKIDNAMVNYIKLKHYRPNGSSPRTIIKKEIRKRLKQISNYDILPINRTIIRIYDFLNRIGNTGINVKDKHRQLVQKLIESSKNSIH